MSSEEPCYICGNDPEMMAYCGNCRANVPLMVLRTWAKTAEIANPEWRKGQCAYNTVWDFRPDVARQLGGTVLDPFNNDEVIEAFWAKVAQLIAVE